MSLREEKKAATRNAISEAAASLLLEEGMGAVTVARVSERAGVSARTFHNYFADIDEALVEFLRKVFAAIAEQLSSLPAELTAAEAMEAIIIDALRDDGFELYSASTLVLLGDRARATSSEPPTEETMRELGAPLVESMRGRTPAPPNSTPRCCSTPTASPGQPPSRRTWRYRSRATRSRGGRSCAGRSRCFATCASAA